MREFIILIVFLVIYFIPWGVARSRKHKSESAILLLNIFLGWTLLGWLWALIWANNSNVRDASSEASPDTHVRCPDCRELVLKEARKCKHCGCKLVPQ